MNILATIDSTEIVDPLTNAQENMQQNVEEVAKNPGIIRTYFENLVPDLISFGLQVVIAILIYVVGAKIIKAILKMMNRSMERAGTDIGVKQFLSTVIKYALYIILIMIILNLFGIATTSVVALIGSAGVAVGLALQGSLANIAGGVLILFLKPFLLPSKHLLYFYYNITFIKFVCKIFKSICIIVNKRFLYTSK